METLLAVSTSTEVTITFATLQLMEKQVIEFEKTYLDLIRFSSSSILSWYQIKITIVIKLLIGM